jgi:hypothetical protein
MEKLAGRPYDAANHLRCLVEAAIFDRNPADLFRRIEEAQDAIMDHMEDWFESASPAERQSMINAMNSLLELRRLVQTHPKIGPGIENLTDT